MKLNIDRERLMLLVARGVLEKKMTVKTSAVQRFGSFLRQITQVEMKSRKALFTSQWFRLPTQPIASFIFGLSFADL